MDDTAERSQESEPLVEIAPEEAVTRALNQSAHPVEFIEAHASVAPAEEPRED